MPDTGKPRPLMKWPGNAYLTLSGVVAFEAFPTASQYLPRPGKPDQSSLSYAEYGPTTGGWRILSLLDAEGIKAGFHVNDQAAERWPLTLQEVNDIHDTLVDSGVTWIGDDASDDVPFIETMPSSTRRGGSPIAAISPSG